MKLKKLLTSTGALITGGVVIGGVVATGIIFGIRNQSNTQTAFERRLANTRYYVDLNGDLSKTPKEDSFTIPVNVFNGITPIGMGDEEKRDEEKRDEEIISLIFKKFFQKDNGANYGPEISSIKMIHINDTVLNNENENGSYISLSREIGLNTPNVADNIFEKERLGIISKDEANGIIAELIYEILFHEYGHHLASQYASNPYDPNLVSKEIHNDSLNGRAVVNQWNKNYLTEFKKILNYDIETPSSPYKKSIASLVDARDAFALSNGANRSAFINLPNVNGKIPYAREPEYYGVSLNENFFSGNYYKYKFSMEELYTRRMIIYGTTFNDDVQKVIGSNFGTNLFGLKLTIPSFISDHLSSASLRIGDLKQNVVPELEDIYFYDYVYDSKALNNERAVKLAQLLQAEMGADNKSNVSYIYSESGFISSERADGGEGIVLVQERNTNLGKTIRIGGMYESGKNYNYIGYMDGANYVSFPIYKTNTNIAYKPSLTSSFKVSLNSSTTSYFTKDMINAESILGKRLYFSSTDTGFDKVAMSSIRANSYGRATNWIEDWKSETPFNTSIYIANKNQQSEVYIDRGMTWWERLNI